MSPLLIDPTGRSAEKPEALADRRFRGLDGMTVGLLDSGKPNSDRLLDDLSELLKERYAIKAFMRRRKPLFSLPAPAEMVSELAESCDVIITGVGD